MQNDKTNEKSIKDALDRAVAESTTLGEVYHWLNGDPLRRAVAVTFRHDVATAPHVEVRVRAADSFGTEIVGPGEGTSLTDAWAMAHRRLGELLGSATRFL